jgi:hypothetical protein
MQGSDEGGAKHVTLSRRPMTARQIHMAQTYHDRRCRTSHVEVLVVFAGTLLWLEIHVGTGRSKTKMFCTNEFLQRLPIHRVVRGPTSNQDTRKWRKRLLATCHRKPKDQTPMGGRPRDVTVGPKVIRAVMGEQQRNPRDHQDSVTLLSHHRPSRQQIYHPTRRTWYLDTAARIVVRNHPNDSPHRRVCQTGQYHPRLPTPTTRARPSPKLHDTRRKGPKYGEAIVGTRLPTDDG